MIFRRRRFQRPRRHTELIAAGLALAVASCGGTSTDTVSSQPTQTTVEETSSEHNDAQLIATADGGQIDWGTLEGQDVVLWFWAPW